MTTKVKNSNNITKLNISSASSLRALEAQAQRAAAIAAARKKEAEQKKKKTENRKQRSLTDIERTMRGIRYTLESNPPAGLKPVYEKPDRNASAYAVISFYSLAEFAEKEGENTNGKKMKPSLRYVFYASSRQPDKLGSIAIYGDGAEALCHRINNSGVLFGLRVVKAEVEWGARPFVDVTLRP